MVLAAPGDAWARVYRVKKGDWLGKISRRFLPGDPFGKGGNVRKIIRLSPGTHHPDEVVPNELIYIPDDWPPKARSKKAVRRARTDAPRKPPAVAAPTACVTAPPAPCRCETPKNCLCPTFDCKCEAQKACVCPQLACPSAAAIMQSVPEAPTLQAASKVPPSPFGAPLQRHLRLRLAPYFHFSELAAQDDDTGATLLLASRYNVGVTAGVSTNVLEHLEVSFELRGGTLDYASPTQNSTLLTSALFSYAATLSTELTVLKRLGICLGVSFGNDPFSASASTQVQQVEMVHLPSASAALRLTALAFPHWFLGAEVAGAYKLGAAQKAYNVNSGTWLYAGVFWQWFNPNDTAWTISAGYSQRQQNTSLITQTDKDIALELSYRWSLESR